MIFSSPQGAFVNQTQVWDVSQLQSMDSNSVAFKELIVRIYQQLNTMAIVLNIKDTAYYSLGEFVNGQLFFPNPALTSETASTARYRQAFRLVVDFGSLPNTATKSVAHGLVPLASWIFTRIYACASDTTGLTYIPIPSLQANLTVDATNVNITTTANLTNYNQCIVVLEYLKF